MRTSCRYPGLKVAQLHGGLYDVQDRVGSRWIVCTNPDAHIGSARRWRAIQRSTGTLIESPTKDALMRHIAATPAAELVRIVA